MQPSQTGSNALLRSWSYVSPLNLLLPRRCSRRGSMGRAIWDKAPHLPLALPEERVDAKFGSSPSPLQAWLAAGPDVTRETTLGSTHATAGSSAGCVSRNRPLGRPIAESNLRTYFFTAHRIHPSLATPSYHMGNGTVPSLQLFGHTPLGSWRPRCLQ